MKNVKPTSYITPELDIITFECNDILTSSGGEEDSNAPVNDENVDFSW